MIKFRSDVTILNQILLVGVVVVGLVVEVDVEVEVVLVLVLLLLLGTVVPLVDTGALLVGFGEVVVTGKETEVELIPELIVVAFGPVVVLLGKTLVDNVVLTVLDAAVLEVLRAAADVVTGTPAVVEGETVDVAEVEGETVDVAEEIAVVVDIDIEDVVTFVIAVVLLLLLQL